MTSIFDNVEGSDLSRAVCDAEGERYFTTRTRWKRFVALIKAIFRTVL
jgi:hypothetical protein